MHADPERSIWQHAQELSDRGIAFVEITLVALRGSAPQELGARALVTPSGIVAGTVGGGKIEARCIAYAQTLLAQTNMMDPTLAASTQATQLTQPQLMTWNLQRDIGMSCGGEVTLFFQVHRRDHWNVVVFGAGHVAQALARVLAPLHAQLTFIDPRAEWLARLPELPHLRRRCEPEPKQVVDSLPQHSFFIVMTQGHATDLPILVALSQAHPHPRYVGAIGSDVKALKLRKDLAQQNVAPEWIERLRCPIGLPFGSNEPHEIALSIAAELIQTRDRIRSAAAPAQSRV